MPDKQPKFMPKIKIDQEDINRFPIDQLEVDSFWADLYDPQTDKNKHIKNDRNNKKFK